MEIVNILHAGYLAHRLGDSAQLQSARQPFEQNIQGLANDVPSRIDNQDADEALSAGLRAGLVAVAALTVVQVALGGWVSSNYAVLACRDFPTCQGSWWPSMDVGEGFNVVRPLGQSGDAGYLPFAALTAIHMAHRLGAVVLLPALLALAWRLHGAGRGMRPWALGLLGLAAWQTASGLSNVLLGWPLAAAVAHTGGAAALVVVLTLLLARSAPRAPVAASVNAGRAPVLVS